jgi:hypothetical protein
MNNGSERFAVIFNHITANNAQEALESFSAAYRETANYLPFLHGIIISLIILGRNSEIGTLLKKEKEVSKYGGSITSLFRFFDRNDFSAMKPADILYNVGVHVARNLSIADAKHYFNAGLLLEPAHRRFLTAIAEHCMLGGEYEKGLRLYAQAAKGE